MLVREWMTKDPISVHPDTSMWTAWRLMRDRRIRHLPVLDAGKLVGIVAEADLRLALPSPATSLDVHEINYLLDKLPVSELMTKAVITTTASTPIQETARTLVRHEVGALPVLEGEALVGILTWSDILESLFGAPAAEAAPCAA